MLEVLLHRGGRGVSVVSDGRECRRMKKQATGVGLPLSLTVLPAFCVSALPTDRELFPFCLCLLPFCPTLLPAVPGGFPWSGPTAL